MGSTSRGTRPKRHIRQVAELGTGFEGMKGLWQTLEVWHCVSGWESLQRGADRLLEKMKPQMK